ncbi:putative cytochrome p450 [Neofusicoccum parvum]|uniref:Cytochrome p450 n=1 Tax=Neofusicoccum parvum TaxID=310453 RepID=A0ACB5S0P4_9PEZI|nr:putative cytochrome p450 [Neofusicoccum parvum]
MSFQIQYKALEGANHPGSILFAVLVVLLTIGAYAFREERLYYRFKLFGKSPGEVLNTKAKERFVKNGVEILKQGFKDSNGKAFRVINTNGHVIILPASLIEEVRGLDHLSFASFLDHDFLSEYPGLEAWQSVRNNIFQDVIKKNLTAAIGPMTLELSGYAGRSIAELLPASKEWAKIVFPAVALVAKNGSIFP